MVEGIWPHVRDDDWCGEWAMGSRPPDTTKSQAMNSLLMQAGAAARAAPPLPTFVSTDAPTDVIQPPISTLMRGHIASD
jgi:hypothetical protein